jgi:hypothetical protein
MPDILFVKDLDEDYISLDQSSKGQKELLIHSYNHAQAKISHKF